MSIVDVTPSGSCKRSSGCKSGGGAEGSALSSGPESSSFVGGSFGAEIGPEGVGGASGAIFGDDAAGVGIGAGIGGGKFGFDAGACGALGGGTGTADGGIAFTPAAGRTGGRGAMRGADGGAIGTIVGASAFGSPASAAFAAPSFGRDAGGGGAVGVASRFAARFESGSSNGSKSAPSGTASSAAAGGRLSGSSGSKLLSFGRSALVTIDGCSDGGPPLSSSIASSNASSVSVESVGCSLRIGGKLGEIAPAAVIGGFPCEPTCGALGFASESQAAAVSEHLHQTAGPNLHDPDAAEAPAASDHRAAPSGWSRRASHQLHFGAFGALAVPGASMFGTLSGGGCTARSGPSTIREPQVVASLCLWRPRARTILFPIRRARSPNRTLRLHRSAASFRRS